MFRDSGLCDFESDWALALIPGSVVLMAVVLTRVTSQVGTDERAALL
jgi:hypothetical protein